jgi:hypothetical protein
MKYMFLQNMKSCIFYNGLERISHIMHGRPFITMNTTKKVDLHRIRRLAINVM